MTERFMTTLKKQLPIWIVCWSTLKNRRADIFTSPFLDAPTNPKLLKSNSRCIGLLFEYAGSNSQYHQMTIRFVFALLFLTYSVSSLVAQEKKKIEILGADILTKGNVRGENVRKLIGSVKMKQGDVYMDCDSAYFYADRNAVDAFGHVYIHQGDLQIYSDSLKYNGDERIADLYGNVRLLEPRMELTTKKLTYNLNTKTAKYSNGGHVISEGTDLVSRIGYYYSENKMAYFRYGVKLVNPNYTLECDTLGYNMEREISYFLAQLRLLPTRVKYIAKAAGTTAKLKYQISGKTQY